jgi:malate dehydrogenase (oxaloacetate-decarboxylating)(NADP+)
MAKVRKREALEFHRAGRPGKIEVVSTKQLTSQRDLSLAYSPGVAEPCMEIHADPNTVFDYTARGNLVAVITNGTAVLGLGDIGPLASKPVMEGKSVLFKKFADIDVFDIELDANDPDRFIDVVCALAPTFGGINLEDIKAPECFYIEEQLRERLDIPVFHDDQHGTAIISGAALLNAAALQSKPLDEIKMVVSGAGASAIACTRFYIRLGVRPEHVLMADSKGVLHSGRDDLNESKMAFVRDTPRKTLKDALEGADLFLGLSRGGLVDEGMVKSMGDRPIIFALANPDPEIDYDLAKKARPDAIVATGRSDFNNQVNNVLGFPGIFRGALDVRARLINEEMKVAAAQALAALAQRDVPQDVNRVYGADYTYGAEYIIPKPFDPRVVQWVAPAVAEAAMETGVAQVALDVKVYRERMRTLLGGATALMRKFVRRAQRDPRRIVFVEGEHPKILEACSILADEGIARPVLLGDPEVIRRRIEEQELHLSAEDYEVINPPQDPRTEAYVAQYHGTRGRKGIDLAQASQRMSEPVYFGLAMVKNGDADGVIGGLDHSYPEIIRPALETIGLAEGVKRAAGMYLMLHKDGVRFFGDTTVNLTATAESQAELAEMIADAAKNRFDVEPRVAFLSYSNFGSVRSPLSDQAARAVKLLQSRRPDLEVEGEMQANVAVDYELQRRRYPFTRLTGPANVLIFPNLESGNVAYKLMRELGGVPAVGPVLLGMPRPVSVLERDCSVDSIVWMSALTVVEAQSRV